MRSITFMWLLRVATGEAILCEATDPFDGAGERGLIEEVWRRVRKLARRTVQLVRAVGRVDRIPQRNLVREHEDRRLGPFEELRVRLGIALGRVVERLAAGKPVTPRVGAL